MSEPTWELLGGGGIVGGPIDYVGDWVAGTTYQPGQVVRYAGVDYLAVNPSTGQVPPLASPVPQAMVCIYDNILSIAGYWDIQNISQAFAHLKIIAHLRGDNAATTTQPRMRFNGDTGANYDHQYLLGAAAAAAAGASLADSSIRLSDVPGATSPAGGAAPLDILIANYGNALFHKQVISWNALRYDAAALEMMGVGGNWRNVAAINRILLQPLAGNFVAGSRLTIYGMLSQGQASPVTTLAPGGIGTAFPVSPTNGELFTLVDSLTAPTYAWDFRYVASIIDAYKWLCVGGDAKIVRSEVDYPSNAALSMTIPRPGYYNLGHGLSSYSATLDAIFAASLTADGAGSYAYFNWRSVGSAGGMYAGSGEHSNVLINTNIAQASGVTGGNRIERRWIKAKPVRLS